MVTETASQRGVEGAVTQYFRYDASTQQFDKKLTATGKMMQNTGKQVKAAGEQGQKALTGWEKALNKAGGAAYDFGTTTIQSTTVMEALQEAAAGSVEMFLADTYSKAEGAMQAWDAIMSGDLEKQKAAWTGFWEKFGVDAEYWGFEASKGIKSKMEAVPGDIQWDGAMKAALAKGDWATVSNALAQNISSGDYSPVDLAIQKAIGLGDYTTAANLIKEKLKGHDWSEVGEAIQASVSGAWSMSAGPITRWIEKLGEAYGETFSPAQAMQAYKDLMNKPDAEFEAALKYHMEKGYLSLSDAMQLQMARANLEMASGMETQLRAAADSFASHIKDPSLYAGLGTTLYNLVVTEINAAGRSGG